jgi:hypothetical protein
MGPRREEVVEEQRKKRRKGPQRSRNLYAQEML